MKYILFLLVSYFAVVQLNTASDSSVLIVTTLLNEPYVMVIGEHKRNSILNRSEITEDLLEGYVIDLLKHLAEKVQFNYSIRLVKDSAYGSLGSGTWNGMIGEVIRGEADLAVADLTITSRRERVVEFSYPFLTTGIGLIAKRPPYYSCKYESNKSLSVKHNCNLHLYPVNEIKDLANQDTIQFGAITSGSTAEFFRTSRNEEFRKIFQNLKTMPSTSDAIKRVKSSNGKYAFLMEEMAIKYLTAKSCDFVRLGPNIHRRAYGIAMKVNSFLKTPINLGLLTLQEEGVLSELEKKWFPEPKECDDRLETVYAKNALNLVLNSLE